MHTQDWVDLNWSVSHYDFSSASPGCPWNVASYSDKQDDLIVHFLRTCWPMTSEVDVGGMAVEVEPSHQYSITCCHVTDGSRGAVWQKDVWHGGMYEAKVHHWIPTRGKMTLIDIHWCLLYISGDQQWVWVHWDKGCCVSGVVAETWKTNHVPDGREDFHKCGMQAFGHCRWKCIASRGHYVEKQCFVDENFLYQMMLLYSLYLM